VTVYAQPELDISFNGNGRATTGFGSGTAAAYKTLVQPDNKIVAIGTWYPITGQKYFALTRYNTDGSLDQSFGEFGRVVTDFNPNVPNEGAFSGAIQPDGKIIAAGYVSIISPGEGYFAMVRYNTNGSIDTTFGNGGRVTTAVIQHINEIRDIDIGPDGRIVAAGLYFSGVNFQTLIACYNANGGLEWTKTDTRGNFLSDSNVAVAVAIQPDGKIITGGSFSTSGGTDITFVRYTASGAYDVSFGSSGRMLVSSPTTNESISDIAVYSDGRIVAVGESGGQLLVMRMFGMGMFDITFSDDGRVTIPGITGKGVYIRPNGKILVAGSGGSGFALASLNTNGSLDTSFSGDGLLDFALSGGGGAYSVTMDSLGRPVLGGTVATGFGVARLYTLEPVPVSISGQARTPDGTPLRGVRVGLTDASGITRWALTSNFGFFSFDDIPTGQTYNLFVRGSKTHIFESRDVGLNEAVSVDLIGTPRDGVKAPSGTVTKEQKKR